MSRPIPSRTACSEVRTLPRPLPKHTSSNASSNAQSIAQALPKQYVSNSNQNHKGNAHNMNNHIANRPIVNHQLLDLQRAKVISLDDRKLIGLELGWLRCPPLRLGDKSIGSLGDFARAWAWAKEGWVDGANVPPRFRRFLRVVRMRARYLRCLGISLGGQRAAIDVWLYCASAKLSQPKHDEVSS